MRLCVCVCVYVCACGEREWHCNGSVLIQLDPHSHIQLTLLHKELCSHSLNLICRYFHFVLIKSVINCVTMVSASKVFITFILFIDARGTTLVSQAMATC